MLNVRSHSSLLWVTMLPPPLIPALLNSKWILSVRWRSATSSRNRSTCVRSATSATCVVTRSPCGNPAASHSLCVSARPVGETSHVDIAGFRHQLADQLAAHSAAAAGDYRGPPHELGHVRPPLRAGADPDMAPQPTLFAGRGVKGSPDRATNFTTSSTERGEPRLGTGKQALLRTARDPFRVAANQQRSGRGPTTRYGKFESISLQRGRPERPCEPYAHALDRRGARVQP